MTLEKATQVAFDNAVEAAMLAETMVPPNTRPTIAQVNALLQYSGKLLCAAREIEARTLGISEPKLGA